MKAYSNIVVHSTISSLRRSIGNSFEHYIDETDKIITWIKYNSTAEFVPHILAADYIKMVIESGQSFDKDMINSLIDDRLNSTEFDKSESPSINNENITLLSDKIITNTIKSTGDSSLDLNGKSIESKNSNIDGIEVGEGSLVISGDGIISVGSDSPGQGSAVYTFSGSTIIIKNGTYINHGNDNNGIATIMLRANSSTKKDSVCMIEGGYFINQAYIDKTEDEVKELDSKKFNYILNAQDQDNSHFILSGGYFLNFNPLWHKDGSDRTSKEIKIKEGYEVVKLEDLEHNGYKGTWYHVQKI